MDPKILKEKIPVIDLSKEDLKPGTANWLSTSKKVCRALEDHGCFLVEFNKPTLELHGQIFKEIEKLYELPSETRSKSISNKSFRGFFSAGPVHESIGIENPTDLGYAQVFTNLMWPHGNDGFCASAYEVSKIMEEMDQMVLRMVFEYYGVEKHFEAQIKSTEYVLRLSKYKEHDQKMAHPPLVVHTDKTFSTILHQGAVKGLELQLTDGQWIPYIPSSHTSFVYLAGEALKVWSNARIRPSYHRVMTIGDKVRYSLGLFAFNNGVIKVPDELVDEEHPLRYKPLDHPEYLKLVVSNAAHYIDYHVEDHCSL